MTAVEGERAAGPPIDDEAPAPPPERVPPPSPPPEPATPDATPEPGPVASSSAGDEPAQHDAAPSDQEMVLPEPREPAEASPPGADGQPDEAPLPEPPASSEPPTSSEPPASVPAGRPVRRRAWRVAGAVLLAALLTTGGGVVGAWAALTLRPPAPPPPAPTPTGLVDAVSAVAPAMLRLQSGAPDTGTAGTALVVTPTGDVVTNEHLVHGESTATLIAPDGRSSTARVIAANEAADIAWLRIDGAQGLPVVHLGGPGAVRPGEDVVAIGNALNLDGLPSVTRGVVSAVGRSTATLTDVIQTDAAISSGSSGGALVDRSGTVVGITTEALVGDPSVSVEDIAFAIPADRVVTVLRGMGLDLPPAR